MNFLPVVSLEAGNLSGPDSDFSLSSGSNTICHCASYFIIVSLNLPYYLSCSSFIGRIIEIPEHDVYICESKYLEAEKSIRKLAKGFKVCWYLTSLQKMWWNT